MSGYISRRAFAGRMVGFLGVGLAVLKTPAFAVQYQGSVVSRDGKPLAGCQIVFLRSGAPPVRVNANSRGAFQVNNLSGKYTVQILVNGNIVASKPVVIDQRGLHPSTLIVELK